MKVESTTKSPTVTKRSKERSLDVKKLEESSISPEDWLERFYNGKNLLRKTVILDLMLKSE